jgi:membrane protein implicated in regulation of membrane protease activity
MMNNMTRSWFWTGAAITVVALTGLIIYFARVGLDKADKAASVVGGLVAVAGLAAAIYGLVSPVGDRRVSQKARASGRGLINQVGGDQQFGPGGAATPAEGSTRQDAVAVDGGQINQVSGNQSLNLPPQA